MTIELTNPIITNKTCSRCGHVAITVEAVAADFGFRTDRGRKYVQPQCVTCRRQKRHANVWDIAPTLTFGVEIEWLSATVGDRSNVAAVVAARLTEDGFDCHASGNYVLVKLASTGTYEKFNFVYDGSCPFGGEMVTPILKMADMGILQSVTRGLKTAGCKTSSNYDSSGIHVHVGAQDLTIDQVRNLARYTNAWESHIKSAVNTAPARRRWCKDMDQAFVTRLEGKKGNWTRADLDSAWYDTHSGHYGKTRKYHTSRYQGLNLHALFTNGTVEFRYFDATTHAGKVRSYVELCLGLVARAKAAKTATSKRKDFSATTADECSASMNSLFAFLEMTGTDRKTARHHLKNNALKSNTLPTTRWSASAEV
jgi:hypothetical protein